jgi:hypothetical protein
VIQFRRLFHPLPLVLTILLVAVAVADLVRSLTEEPPPPPEIVGTDTVHFVAFEPVIDLRPDRQDLSIEIRPKPEFAGARWSVRGPFGLWAKGADAEFSIDLTTGGHRALVIECAPAAGKRVARRARLTVNGIDCGETAIEPGWQRCRWPLPEGAVRSGRNTFGFVFPDRQDARRVRRTLAIRKLGLFFDREIEANSLSAPVPVTVDFDSERVSMRRGGVLEIPVVLEDRTDALQLRYRFDGGGRATVEVEQHEAGLVGVDEAMRQSFNAADEPTGRIRIPLHGRRGSYRLRIRADLPAADDRLLISSLRLVEEGDPTRRPWAASRPPD